jgi:hypothetical protein
MPSNSKLFVKPFIGGLNTELSNVEDAVLYTSDELNCTILPEGLRGRRLGFNIEKNGKWTETSVAAKHSTFIWDNVSKKDFNYLVTQSDTTLYIFEDTTKDPVYVLDLLPYKVETNVDELAYATCAGDLIIVGSWIDPIKISYDTKTNEFNIVKVNIKWRDLVGVDDGLKVDETQTELTPEHKYNLFNQGWDKLIYDDNNTSKQSLQAFYDEVKYYPSNSMLHYLDKNNDAKYDAHEILKHYYGNTPAPKGHFILDYFTRSRGKASGISLQGAVVVEQNDTFIIPKESEFTKKICGSNGSSLEMTATGSDLIKASELFTDTSNIVKEVPIKHDGGISSITFKVNDGLNPNGAPFTYTNKEMKRSFIYHTGSEGWYLGPVEVSLIGITGEERTVVKSETYIFPEDGFVGSEAISDTWAFDSVVTHDKYILQIRLNGVGDDSLLKFAYRWGVSTNIVTEEVGLPSTDVVDGRIKDIATLGGRYFYLVGDTVLFSQVLKDNGEGYDACHQDADPTSEEISDVIATDGGYVKFPSMGEGLAIKAFNRGVLIFGKSCVNGIISPNDDVFTATSYDVVELSRAGLIGPKSVVSTSDAILYWSPLGIFKIGLHPETNNTIVAQSVSIDTIQEHYNNISISSKENCKGVYDYVNNRVYWYYPTSDRHIEKLDGCLVYDLTYGSFMSFKIGDNESSLPYIASICQTPTTTEIKPTMFVRAGEDIVTVGGNNILAAPEQESFRRWTALKHLIIDNDKFSFGDYNSRDFKDFDKHIFDSYMVSRPIMFTGYSAYGKVVNSTYEDRQVPILQTLFKRTEQSVLAPKNTPEFVTYDIKDYRDYIETWKEYQESSGVLVRHSIAESYISGNTGKFTECAFKIDLKNFQGNVINLGIEIQGDNKVIATAKKTALRVDTFYYDIVVPANEEKVCNNYKIIVSVEINSQGTGTVTDKPIHFDAKFSQIRTNMHQKPFIGFKEVVYSDTVRVPLNKTGAKININPSYAKKATLTVIPTLTEGEEWTTLLECGTDVGVDFFRKDASYSIAEYNTFKDTRPTRTPYAQSIRNNRLSTQIYIKSTSTSDNVEAIDVKYEFTMLEPVYGTLVLPKYPTEYMAASGANIRIRWGWALDSRSNRWDMIQNGYRPQKDFLHDEYVESRIHVRGRGKAFQVEVRNDSNKDFRLAGMNLLVRNK